MNIIFTVPAPLEIYMFKNFYKMLIKEGNSVTFVVRDYSCNKDLIKFFRLPSVLCPIRNSFFFSKIGEMIFSDILNYKIIRQLSPDIIIGDSLLGHIAKALKVPSIAFVDGDAIGTYRYIYKFFYWSEVFVTPEYVNLDIPFRTHIKYPGFQELAYLHPRYFSPNRRIFDYLGIDKGDSYVILRFAAFDASHDFGLKGLSHSQKIELVNKLEKYAYVFISSELPLGKTLSKYQLKIPPYMIHDALYFANLLIAETAMIRESAIIGTQPILITPLSKFGYTYAQYGGFRFLRKLNLLKIFTPHDIDEIIAFSSYVLSNPKYKNMFYNKVKNLIYSKSIDLVEFGVWFIKNYPVSKTMIMSQLSLLDKFRF